MAPLGAAKTVLLDVVKMAFPEAAKTVLLDVAKRALPDVVKMALPEAAKMDLFVSEEKYLRPTQLD